MASEDEDVDLQALRNAVLATLKSSPVRSKDEEDLEVLRLAALSSKKSIEKKLNVKNLSFHDGHSRIRSHHNDMFCWRRPNSNLIEIQTLPIEELQTNHVYHGSFRPINSTPLVKEEPSSQLKDNKPKRSSKFSRFESDSDSDSDSNYDFLLSSSSSDSTKEDDDDDDTGSVLEMSQTQQEENSLDQTASQSSDKENEDNESISSLNKCDEVSKCDKKDNAEGEQSAANRDETTRHQRVNQTVEKVSEEKSEQTELDSDRARMEARKRKFESKQCVVLDKSKKISLKQIVGSSKAESVERRPNSDSEERNHRKSVDEAVQSRTTSSASMAFADPTEDLRVSLKQRREERRNGRRKRKRKDASSSPSRASPVIKSVLSIVKVESQKKERKEKRTERSRRNKTRKKSPSPHLHEGKSHQNGKKLPVRLRLGRPVNKKDEESDVDKSASSSSRKREKKRNSTKRSRKELSAGVSDPYPAVEILLTLVLRKRIQSRPFLCHSSTVVNVYDHREFRDYQFKVNYDLEAKIRRIREQNQAIMRRRDEVAADRKKHT
uniref:Uncharacterized protein n=1 Tax=Strigamia maritima TaxID=126957 RepID=T1JFC7_STRMM